MAEPINLWRGNEQTTVYGKAQAEVFVAQGWQIGTKPADVEPAAAPAPAMDAEPEAEARPVKKHAGEYGQGPHSGPETRVDKAKKAEVKAERAQDRKDGVL